MKLIHRGKICLQPFVNRWIETCSYSNVRLVQGRARKTFYADRCIMNWRVCTASVTFIRRQFCSKRTAMMLKYKPIQFNTKQQDYKLEITLQQWNTNIPAAVLRQLEMLAFLFQLFLWCVVFIWLFESFRVQGAYRSKQSKQQFYDWFVMQVYKRLI